MLKRIQIVVVVFLQSAGHATIVVEEVNYSRRTILPLNNNNNSNNNNIRKRGKDIRGCEIKH
jgi:hypothetical protein